MPETNENQSQRTRRNTSPLAKLMDNLGKEGYINWMDGAVLSFVSAGKDGKKVGLNVPLTDFVGRFTESNITTLFNRYNPLSAAERRINDIARELRKHGMNDAADEIVAKFKAEQDKPKSE